MSLKTWLICSLVLAPLSAGQPAGKLRRRQQCQDIPHGLDIIVYDEEVASATRVREVIEWVNEAGELVGTATENVLLLPTSLAPNAVSNETAVSSATTPHCTKTLLLPCANGSPSENGGGRLPAPGGPQASVTASKTAGPPAAKMTPAPPSSAGDNKDNTSERFGVSYTPYRADQGCKSQQDVDDDFKRMAGRYSVIRVYGTDCNQVSMLHSAAKAHKMKLFLGIWKPSSVQDEADKIIAGLNGDWDIVHTVSVGNELVNNGQASPQEIIRAVSQARSILRAAGYNGPVVAVDTFTAVLAHPELCNESDYCAVNAHAFFDSTTSPSECGQWLQNTISNIRSVISDHDKKIVITETGWPTRGASNGRAVPGLENQKVALHSIKQQFSSNPENIFLFSAFNDLWKKEDMATFNTDRYWGIEGAVSSCDQ
ncbi:hypothetical protein E4U55_006786 [Claviceps digitariae]|nr:hypothetical protein E4U55_006786 [Claviceps digitariae]